MRLMFDLPRSTHRNLIEAISHLKRIILKRFLLFLKQVKLLSKVNLLNMIQYDTRSVRGLNLRQIMLLLGRDDISEIEIGMIENITYAELPEESSWRANVAREIIDEKYKPLEIVGFDANDLEEIFEFVCTQ